ncbi:MAG TPA: hypothetical protein VFY93_06660 [Planctomycetota bacterium]|nr:hypothetical protein [Planctomycetota bacterium]
MARAASDGHHHWKFFRAGGVDQVKITSGADILHLGDLDQKLWVALSCPVKGLFFDERTLDLLDSDRDGRVRVPEIVAASRWLGAVLKDADVLLKGEDGVALTNLRQDTPEGTQVLKAAQHILRSFGKEAAGRITVDDTTRTAEMFAKAPLNGDGIVAPETVGDEAARKVGAEIVDCLGGAADRSGKPGFDKERIDRFFADAAAYAAWWSQGEADRAATWPLKDRTADAAAALAAVRAKLDDYFARCQLAEFDARALAAVNRTEGAFLDAAARDMTIDAHEIVSFPVALAEPGKPFPLAKGVNPAWRDAIERFRSLAVAPLLGKDKASLTREEWLDLRGRFAAYDAWEAGKQGASVEKLGIKRVREILGGDAKARLEEAAANDLAVAPVVEAIGLVEKLARLHRDFYKLLTNFVSFADFYGRRKAIFQAGVLYLDGRSCDLCIRVNDPAKHGLLAAMAQAYLVYADCKRPSGDAMTIAAAVTAGDSDNLFVGRNGLFYDRQGRDWDATVTKIVNNPISIGQAFWSPYKKVLRWIEEQVAKRAAAADEAATARMQTTATTAAAGQAPPPAAPGAPQKKLDIGVVAAIGVAVSGFVAAVSAMLGYFFGLGKWVPLGVLGVILLISGPSMLIAYLKLRRRNLGPILDANGWAVNTLTKVNLPLGRSLTAMAALPKGAERSLSDPFAEKRSPWPRILLVLILLSGVAFCLWKTGYASRWWDRIPKPEKVWFERKPAEEKPAEEKPAETGK